MKWGLDKKLLRDLNLLRGQIVTIALVVACGIGAYVGTTGTYQTILEARDRFYAQARFADAFVSLVRAPKSLAHELATIPGVASIETRLVEPITVPLDTLPEPVRGIALSQPVFGEPRVNALSLRRGRWLDSTRSNEALVIESFARAHALNPGDTLPVVLNGKLREVTIAGIVLSPEYVFPIGGLDFFPDDARFAVLWLSESALAAAYDMDGAFNHAAMQLEPTASLDAVVASLDKQLAPYGGNGAYGRDKQLSHRFVTGELQQLRATATVIPLIFLGVAAFLLNVVLSRLIILQRPEIAALKALGYFDREIGAHYFKLIAVIVVLGALMGLGLGAWAGDAFTALYAKYFRFPVFEFRLSLSLSFVAIFVSLVAAAIGGFSAVRSIVRLAPAEAMRPPAPAVFRESRFERWMGRKLLGPAARMVLRELLRRPVRALLSSVGIAMAIAILILGRFGFDAVGVFMDLQFAKAQREDVTVALLAPVPYRAARTLAREPGVRLAEPLRSLGVRFRHGARERTAALIAYPGGTTLRQIVEWPTRIVPVPRHGVLLTRELGRILDVAAGDTLEVELLEGSRKTVGIPIAGFVDEPAGLQGHIAAAALAHLLGEEETANVVLLRVDADAREPLQERLKELPGVAGVMRIDSVIARFNRQMDESFLLMSTILTAFAAVIAAGVIYNNARVSLSMRERELASLRVLGFTRAEVSWILLAELGVQVVVAVPIGMAVGTWLAHGVASLTDPELMRFPAFVSANTHVFAIVVVALASLAAALLVRSRVDHLDLIGVLKTRE